MRIYYFGELIQSESPKDLNCSGLNIRDEKTDFTYENISEDTLTDENQAYRSENSAESFKILGGLGSDTNNPKQKTVHRRDALATTTAEIIEKNIITQTALLLDETQPEPAKPKTGMPSLGDLLQDIDMSLDAMLPFQFRSSINRKMV